MNNSPDLFWACSIVLLLIFYVLLKWQDRLSGLIASLRNFFRKGFRIIRERGHVCEILGQDILPARLDAARSSDDLIEIVTDVPASQFSDELQQRFLEKCDRLHLSREAFDKIAHVVERDDPVFAHILRKKATEAIISLHSISGPFRTARE